jgi:hypothetical protein
MVASVRFELASLRIVVARRHAPKSGPEGAIPLGHDGHWFIEAWACFAARLDDGPVDFCSRSSTILYQLTCVEECQDSVDTAIRASREPGDQLTQ